MARLMARLPSLLLLGLLLEGLDLALYIIYVTGSKAQSTGSTKQLGHLGLLLMDKLVFPLPLALILLDLPMYLSQTLPLWEKLLFGQLDQLVLKPSKRGKPPMPGIASPAFTLTGATFAPATDAFDSGEATTGYGSSGSSSTRSTSVGSFL